MPIRDLVVEPIDTFRASGQMDDLMLGLLGPGRDDATFRGEDAERIKRLRGERRRDAKVKILAICPMVGVQVDELVGDVAMWIDEVKDSPVVREIIRIAGRKDMEEAKRKGHAEGLAEGRAEGLARAVVMLARSRGAQVDDGYVDHLVAYADEDTLRRMMVDERSLDDDLDAFVTAHGVASPGLTS